MLIREVEKLTGIKDVNIRYYEKEGLIHPERKSNGYREYSDADVELIRQIKVLRLLEVPVPLIKQVLNGNLSLQAVIQKRLNDLNEEEQKLKEIKSSCENILSVNIGISDLSEDLLCGNKSAWKARLEQIMKEDIDKRFIGNSVLYIIAWAIFTKLFIGALYAHSFETIISSSDTQVIGLSRYICLAVGAFLILYGIGLTVFEALTGKGFLWVWGTNWSGGGLGGLANSFAFLGIGVGCAGIKWSVFFVMLFIMCLLSSSIRAYLMYRNKKAQQNVPKVKNSVFILITCVLLLAVYIGFLGILFHTAKTDPDISTGDKPEHTIDSSKIQTINITIDNWEDYFEHKDEIIYEKNDAGDITLLYLDSWFELKPEYYEQLSKEQESNVNFAVNFKRVNKEYKITDPKTGEYEIVGDAPSNYVFGGIGTPENTSICWNNLPDDERENYASLYLNHGNQEPYMEIYENFKIKAVRGTLYLKK